MAAVDIAFVRSRLASRPLTAVLTVATLGWLAFVLALFARDSYRIAESFGFVHGLRPIAELQALYGAAVIAVAAGVAVALLRPSALALLVRGAVATAVAVMALLSVTSGQVGDVAVFVGLMAWSWFVGAPALVVLQGREAAFDGAGRVALEIALGMGALSFGVLAIALAGLLGGLSLALLLLAGLVLAAPGWAVTKPWRGRWGGRNQSEDAPPLVEYVALVLILALLCLSFGASLAPQTGFDALHYHFAMPRILLAEGRFVERPDIVQSYFPLGLEMTYVPALRFGGETTMTLMHWAFAPMLMALVWSGAGRIFGRTAGALAAAFIGLTALVTHEASSASSDLVLTLWLVAAAVAVAAYAGKPSLRLALMAGLFGGFALTFKIVAGIYLLPIGIAFLAGAALSKLGARALVRHAAVFGVAGLLTGAPWLLIRLVQTGNPIFPLYNNVFRSDKWPPVNERFDLWLFGIGHSLTDAVSVWWEVSLHPWRFGQWMAPWAAGITVLVFAAAIPMSSALFRSRERAVIVALAVLAAGAWFFLSQYHRYGLPAFSLLAIAGGAGMAAALRQAPRPLASAAAGLTLLVLFAGAGASAMVMGVPGPFPTRVVLGEESREAYRDRTTADYYPIRFLDDVTRGTDDRAAILGYPYNYFMTNRLYDTGLPAEASPFSRVVRSGAAPADMARQLLANRVRWLVVDYNPVGGESPWPPEYLVKGVLSPEFLNNYTDVVFQKYNVFVYRIRGP